MYLRRNDTMLYRFKSRATADVVMLEHNGRHVLEIIGKDASAQGIVTVAQIPGAIAKLEAAIAREEEVLPASARPAMVSAHAGVAHGTHPIMQNGLRADVHTAVHEPVDGDEVLQEEAISLRHRSAPFLDMLRRSAEEGKDVVWGV
jgi:cyclopropane-fatty-acyl-phospholipid synthase